MKKRVALIFGGEGREREISEKSAENLDSLINKEKYDVIYVGISPDAQWYIYAKNAFSEWISDDAKTPTFPLMLDGKSGFYNRGKILEVSVAIPCLHGDFGEDGVVQGALTLAHINYIGQDVYASALTSDKAYTRAASDLLGIPGARWILLTADDTREAKRLAEEKIGYPMFIKPARQGSSFGSHPIYSEADFEAAYKDARGYGKRVLAEELLQYDFELECAFFKDGEERYSAGGRILSGGNFYDYRSKYDGNASPKTEAKSGKFPLAEALAEEYSKRLSDFIGIRDLARFDYFVTRDGRVYFNEINVFPGMTKTSLYPTLTEDMGLKRGDFINLLISGVSGDDRRL